MHELGKAALGWIIVSSGTALFIGGISGIAWVFQESHGRRARLAQIFQYFFRKKR